MSSIYKDIAEIQKELMGMKIKKSGKNKFAKFNYHELEDLLPVIVPLCFERELIMNFTFTKEEAILKIRNWNTPGEVVSTRVPMPEVRELNGGMNIMQSEGAYITYLKRYLLTNMFLIMEKDVVDSTGLSKTSKHFKKEEKNHEPSVNYGGRPKGEKVTGEVKAPNDLIKSVVEYCNNLKKTPNAHSLNLSATGMKRKGLISKTDLVSVQEFTKTLQDEDLVIV